MNDINEMPPKCQYCPYWEVCEYPWVCPDREQLATNLQQTCNQLTTDTISRQAAIDTLNVDAELLRRVLDETDIVGTERAKYEWGLGLIESNIADIKELPSAQPERRKGRWRKGVCECGYDWAKDAPISSVPNFCPQCGADMRQREE